jgi:predicted permease
LDTLRQDLSYALRSLRQRPGFTLAAVLTLTLGIGVNTGIFSIVYGILLRPLPYTDADRLVLIEAERDFTGSPQPVPVFFPWTDLEAWQRGPVSFASVAFYATDVGVMTGPGGRAPVEFATVTTSFFSTLRGEFLLGRPLGPTDDGTAAMVISEGLWRKAFGGTADILGQRVQFGSRRGDSSQRATWQRAPFTIVDVAANSFQFPTPTIDAWADAAYVRTLERSCCSFLPVMRLKNGATREQAQTDAAAVAQGLGVSAQYDGLRVSAISLHDRLVDAVRPSLLILTVAVGLVLLVACANVMNLQLASSAGRTRETAVRLALGASRLRLLRQSLVESGVLATLGATAGLLVAWAMVGILRRVNPAGIPRLDAVEVDAIVVLFSSASAVLVTLLTGAAPGLRAGHGEGLTQSEHGTTVRPAGTRTRRALVSVELAIAVMLLVGALLLGRSLVQLLNTDIGVNTSGVVTATLDLAFDRDLTAASQTALVNRVLERISRLPGVTATGAGTGLPPNEGRIILTLSRNDERTGVPGSYRAQAVPATPGYFSTLGIPLLRGRFFTDADNADRPPVMIMTAGTARRFFGDGDPIGRTLGLPVIKDGVQTNAMMTLVGVIRDVKYSGLEQPADDAIYRPFAQQPWPSLFLVARAERGEAALIAALPREIAALDPGIQVSDVAALETIVADAAAQPRFGTWLLGALAVLALSLAAVGLYGVLAYLVSQRTRELGIRMALGATGRDVVRMIVGEGMLMAAIGITSGVAAAYALAKMLAAVLYGVTPTDVTSFVSAAGFVLLLAWFASYIPARRAIAIDPAVALRAQ